MTPAKLLRKIGKQVNFCDELGIAFILRVYEFLGQADEFGLKFSEESLNINNSELLDGLMSMDEIDYKRSTCGLENGDCGFKFLWDIGYFDSLEYLDETFLDDLAVFSDYFASGAELLEAITKLDHASRPMEDTELRQIMFAEGGLWDIMNAAFSGYMDYIPEYAPDKVKSDLLNCIITAWCDRYGEGLFNLQHVCSVTNPGLDDWMLFLHTSTVSNTDRKRSKNVIGKMLGEEFTVDEYNTEITFYSHSKDSTALYRRNSYAPDKDRAFSMVLFQMSDTGYYGGPIVSSFACGIISPYMMAAMMDVKQFLEEMEEKYHFLSCKEVRAYEQAA